MRLTLTLFLFVLTSVPVCAKVTIFAAISTSNALDEILASEDIGLEVITSYAGSGTLARQIHAGAPADIFLSANTKWVDWLESEDRLEADSRVDLLTNRLVLIGRPYQNSEIVTLEAALDALKGKRLAIGNVTSVPAGIYAHQALIKLGVWTTHANGFVEAESVRTVLNWVAYGEADGGFVYATDVRLSDDIQMLASVPEELHNPIRYPLAIVGGRERPEVDRLYNALLSLEAREIFLAHGFGLPVEARTDEGY